MKKPIFFVIAVVALIIVASVLNIFIHSERQKPVASDISSDKSSKVPSVPSNISNYRSAEYVIAGNKVLLINGVLETETAPGSVPGSVSKITTRYFGNELKIDLNGDEREDVVGLVTQETGGSGKFYYVVAALNTVNGYVGSSALLLGDRIAPQTIEKGQGKIIIVNYADRAPGESFSTQPSVAKSIWLILDPVTMQFGEVEKDFSGEANPGSMTLGMKTWNWVSASYNDGREIIPKQAGKFTIKFSSDNTFSATTDCNRIGGKYKVVGSMITFSEMSATEMACQGSEEAEFAKLLENTSSYHFTSRGELILDLKFDSGTAMFK